MFFPLRVVRIFEFEARGIVLDSKNKWNVVAKGFDRFFNVGEIPQHEDFNWRRFDCTTKEDGSLILVYFYRDEWHVNTSGSFGLSTPEGYKGTWQDLFWEYSGNLRGKLLRTSQAYTLIFELCTPVNKVVRRYENPGIFLIGVNSISQQYSEVIEFGRGDVESIADTLGCRVVDRHIFNSKSKLEEWLLEKEAEDPTFEGVVIRDHRKIRCKWKTKSYTTLHHLFDNGNVILPKNLVNIVMGGEYSEVSTNIPEVKPALDEVSEVIEKAFAGLAEVWLSNRELESQKDFAMNVKEHPFFYILFKARKKLGSTGTAEDLKKIWQEEDNYPKIAKRLFAGKKFEFAKPALLISG